MKYVYYNDKIQKGNEKYIINDNVFFKNEDLKENKIYNLSINGNVLIQDKDYNKHTVQGEEYYRNGKVEDAIKLEKSISKLPTIKKPQSDMLDLALNELKITILELKQLEADNNYKQLTEYIEVGFNEYKMKIREYVSKLPKLNAGINDDLIKEWFYMTIGNFLKSAYNNEMSLNYYGMFVGNKDVKATLKHFKVI